MIFSLAIYSAPYSSQSSDSALKFAHALLDSAHTLLRVFFYHDAVHHASELTTPPQDDINRSEQWQSLAAKHNIDLVVCISAAHRRGLISENIAAGFRLGGLGQLLEATILADRFLIFG